MVVKFKKNKIYQLDDVINYMGIIPLECYEQDDIAEYETGKDNDGGETVKFLKNVEIKYLVKIKD